LAGGVFLALASDGFGQGKGKGNSGANKGSSSSSQGKSGNSGKSDPELWSGSDDKSGKGKNGAASSGGSDNRYKGLSKKLGMSQDEVRNWYESERKRNPDLNYGRFVAANMIAKNRDGISANRILDGLRNGDSIGQTLQREGWSERRIEDERKRIKKMMKDEGYDDYKDRDDDWIFRRR
jgi:hypothetical protein